MDIADPGTLMSGADFSDGAIPPRVATPESGLLWLAHDRMAGRIWRVLVPLSGGTPSGLVRGDGTSLVAWIATSSGLQPVEMATIV